MIRRIFISILFLLGVILFGCLALYAIYLLTEPASPVSPPETQLGTESSFDTILANANEDWRFLFMSAGQLTTSDIYGQNDQVLLDFADALGIKCYDNCGEGSLSPDSKYLIIQYNTGEHTETGTIIYRLIIFDLENGSFENIPTPLPEFQLDSSRSVIWVKPTVFLVRMHRWIYKDTHKEKIVNILRYDLQSLDNPQLIESEYFYTYCYRVWQRRNDFSSPNIKVEPVISDPPVEGWGRYFDENWNRSFIYLNNILVRVSDRDMGNVVWDSDLELFIWGEYGVSRDFYYMDAQDHYHSWRNGSYWGKIPRNLQATNYQKQDNTDC